MSKQEQIEILIRRLKEQHKYCQVKKEEFKKAEKQLNSLGYHYERSIAYLKPAEIKAAEKCRVEMLQRTMEPVRRAEELYESAEGIFDNIVDTLHKLTS
jgi:hypothetical protein